MSQAIPSVQQYMTASPCTIGADQTLARAHDVLRERRIRHLPVLRGGQLVGMISERDLALVEAFRDVDPDIIRVEDAMSPEVFTVTPETPIDAVVSEMASKKYGSAVIMQHDKVVGIFTTVDVCRAFMDLLGGRWQT
jgi:acetoin utilization protein AcuB